jgi:predicted 3-demethylubiquinone-9 3-methyltransferase (glyoxalase superfamily)
MSPITPCLWFDDNLEEAMEFYVKIFPTRPSARSRATARPDPGSRAR